MVRQGWYGERHRHSLAAKGVQTKRYMQRRVPFYRPESEPGDFGRPGFLEATFGKPGLGIRGPEKLRQLEEGKPVSLTEKQQGERLGEIQGRVAELSDEAATTRSTGIQNAALGEIRDLRREEEEIRRFGIGRRELGERGRTPARSRLDELREFERSEAEERLKRME